MGMERSQATALPQDRSPPGFAGSIPSWERGPGATLSWRSPAPPALWQHGKGRALAQGCARVSGDIPDLQTAVPRASKSPDANPSSSPPGAPCCKCCSC